MPAANNSGANVDIEGMSLRDLSAYQKALMADVISGAVTRDEANTIVERIEGRLSAAEQAHRLKWAELAIRLPAPPAARRGRALRWMRLTGT
jgi:hypothetical protein